MNELIAALLRASQHRFIGRLGSDPETRFFDSGKSITTVNIAVNRPGAKRDDGQKPDWFKVEIWNEDGQAMADALHKGDLVEVSGRVKTETWNDKQTGEERRALCIQAESWAPAGQQRPAAPAPAPTGGGWQSSDQDLDDVVPF